MEAKAQRESLATVTAEASQKQAMACKIGLSEIRQPLGMEGQLLIVIINIWIDNNYKYKYIYYDIIYYVLLFILKSYKNII